MHTPENGRKTQLENDRKCTHWKMTEKAQLEKDRKCTHRKMAEKAHIGNIQTSGRNSTIGNIQTRKMTENVQSEISRLGKWQI